MAVVNGVRVLNPRAHRFVEAGVTDEQIRALPTASLVARRRSATRRWKT